MKSCPQKFAPLAAKATQPKAVQRPNVTSFLTTRGLAHPVLFRLDAHLSRRMDNTASKMMAVIGLPPAGSNWHISKRRQSSKPSAKADSTGASRRTPLWQHLPAQHTSAGPITRNQRLRLCFSFPWCWLSASNGQSPKCDRMERQR